MAYDTGKDDLGVTAWDVGCFFTFPEGTQDEEVTLSDFYDLFGCSGVSITYPDHDSNRTVHDYYTLSDSGDPMRLARVYGTAAAVDLDGDGMKELAASEQSDAQLIFQRDNTLYEVDPGPAGCFPPGRICSTRASASGTPPAAASPWRPRCP